MAAGIVTALSRNSGQLDLFTVREDGRVWTMWWNATDGWSDWRSLGGFFPAGAPVTAVARTGDNLDLFITGNDGRVYTSWWYNGVDWSGINDNWRPLGGFFPAGAPVAAVARTGNNLDLFITGNDGRVYTSWWFNGGDGSGPRNLAAAKRPPSWTSFLHPDIPVGSYAECCAHPC